MYGRVFQEMLAEIIHGGGVVDTPPGTAPVENPNQTCTVGLGLGAQAVDFIRIAGSPWAAWGNLDCPEGRKSPETLRDK